jgi:drug/metabolite transporter (DMT)-like permease
MGHPDRIRERLRGVILARLILGERVTRTLNAAVAVGFIGSVLIGLREAGHGATLVGDLLVLGASATAALYGVGSRRFGRDADTLPATSLQLVTAAVLAVPLVIGEAIRGASHLGSADGVHIGAAVAVGLLGGVLPFLAFNASIRDMSLARASLHFESHPSHRRCAGGSLAERALGVG